jgi:hypothetical protein
LAASCGLQLQVTSSLFKDDGTKFEVICFSDGATDIELEVTSTMLHIPVYILSEWAQSMMWQRFTQKFPLPIPFFLRSPYITILNTGAHYMLVRNVIFNCNCFSPRHALEINNNIDIPEVIICKDEKFSPIRKRKIDFDLNGITRHAIFEIPKDTRKPAKNKKLSASDKFYEAIYEGPTHQVICVHNIFLWYYTFLLSCNSNQNQSPMRKHSYFFLDIIWKTNDLSINSFLSIW